MPNRAAVFSVCIWAESAEKKHTLNYLPLVKFQTKPDSVVATVTKSQPRKIAPRVVSELVSF